MAFELPELPYAKDALAPYMSAETLEFHHDKHHQAYVTNGNKLLEGSGLEGKIARGRGQGELRQERRPLQQCRPALQPHPFLEVDEAQWRRQVAAGRAAEGGRQRSRRLRQVPRRFRRCRHDAVRLGLGLDLGQERQARSHQDRRTARARWSTAARRSSASMCGSTATTSTTATRGRSTSRPGSTTSSTGTTCSRCTKRRSKQLSAAIHV